MSLLWLTDSTKGLVETTSDGGTAKEAADKTNAGTEQSRSQNIYKDGRMREKERERERTSTSLSDAND